MKGKKNDSKGKSRRLYMREFLTFPIYFLDKCNKNGQNISRKIDKIGPKNRIFTGHADSTESSCQRRQEVSNKRNKYIISKVNIQGINIGLYWKTNVLRQILIQESLIIKNNISQNNI